MGKAATGSASPLPTVVVVVHTGLCSNNPWPKSLSFFRVPTGQYQVIKRCRRHPHGVELRPPHHLPRACRLPPAPNHRMLAVALLTI